MTTTLLDNFPSVNPYLERPPRRDEGWTWRGISTLAAIGLVSIALFTLHVLNVVNLSWIGIAAFFGSRAGVVGLPLVTLDAFRRSGWRHGQIVPARVIQSKRTSILLALVHLALMPVAGLGLILHFATGGIEFTVVETVVNGKVRRYHTKYLHNPPSMPTVWIALPGWLRPAIIVAESYVVPPEAESWLHDALGRADNPYPNPHPEYRGQINDT